jgi:nicotinate phosphoribosyltransferase
VDGYGVGTSLVTGSGAPTCSFVYKLVARAEDADPASPLLPVAKKSQNKSSIGGRKFALRRLGPDGRAEAEVVGIGAAPADDGNDRPLLVELVRGGEIVGREPLAAARERHARAVAELPSSARKMSRGEPVIETLMLDELGQPTHNPYATKEA